MMKYLNNTINLNVLTEEQRQYVMEMYVSALNDINEYRIISKEPHSPIDINLQTYHNGLNTGTIVALLGLFGSEPFKSLKLT